MLFHQDATLETPVGVVIVDANRAVAEMLARVLRETGGFEVLGIATDGPTGIKLLAEYRPALLVVDLRLPGIDGVGVARQAIEMAADIAVLVLGGFGLGLDPLTLLRLGVRGYVPKTVSLEELVSAIQAVARGRTVLLTESPSSTVEPMPHPLTAREQEVLNLLATGSRNADIAEALSLSLRAVEAHVTHLREKLGARSRTEVVLKGQQLGLVLAPTTSGAP